MNVGKFQRSGFTYLCRPMLHYEKKSLLYRFMPAVNLVFFPGTSCNDFQHPAEYNFGQCERLALP